MIPFFGTTGWQIGFLRIQSWGLFVALGFLISFAFIWWLGKRQKLNFKILSDLFVWVVVWSLVWGRLFYVFFEGYAVFFLAHPKEILKIWEGGMSSFGGFFGAGLVLYLFWKQKKINWQYLDVLALALPFGWAVGRIGCLLIHDHPGILSNSFLAIRFPEGSRLDMALLEILMLLPLLALFVLRGLKMLKCPALLSSVVFLWYGVGRFLLDFWRPAAPYGIADARYLGLTIAQWGSAILIIFSLSLLKKFYGRKIWRIFNDR